MIPKPPYVSPRIILSDRVVVAVKLLLETKHLYQSVLVGFSTTDVKAIAEAEGVAHLEFLKEWTSLIQDNWIVGDHLDVFGNRRAILLGKNIIFVPPDIKTVCTICDRIEAFNPITAIDFCDPKRAINETTQGHNGTIQVFVFSYLCQSCKSVPEVFLVRRDGSKLTLSGRTPMEHIDVPKDIPKSVKEYYSGALVAYQSGQTLAANFLLRTLIERFSIDKVGDVDKPAEEYTKRLPQDFKERFPSLSDFYKKLSDDIHKAEGSAELFEDSRTKIIKHFEARKVFDLE
jgi:hypothetical protein